MSDFLKEIPNPEGTNPHSSLGFSLFYSVYVNCTFIKNEKLQGNCQTCSVIPAPRSELKLSFSLHPHSVYLSLLWWDQTKWKLGVDFPTSFKSLDTDLMISQIFQWGFFVYFWYFTITNIVVVIMHYSIYKNSRYKGKCLCMFIL